jgi:hypothetical protein
MMTGIGTPSSQSKMPRPMIGSYCLHFLPIQPAGRGFVPDHRALGHEDVRKRSQRGLRRREAPRRSIIESAAASAPPSQPLLRKPAETPLIVSWMPVSTLSLVERLRWIFSNSTWMWFSGSR